MTAPSVRNPLDLSMGRFKVSPKAQNGEQKNRPYPGGVGGPSASPPGFSPAREGLSLQKKEIPCGISKETPSRPFHLSEHCRELAHILYIHRDRRHPPHLKGPCLLLNTGSFPEPMPVSPTYMRAGADPAPFISGGNYLLMPGRSTKRRPQTKPHVPNHFPFRDK
jgi:hypothetical protein